MAVVYTRLLLISGVRGEAAWSLQAVGEVEVGPLQCSVT